MTHVISAILIKKYSYKAAAFRTKWILLILFGLGYLTIWSGSEAVLPAYLTRMILAKELGKDHIFIRRLRTLTVGFLTPFYFIRAGSFVSLPSLFASKIVSKIFGLFPAVNHFSKEKNEKWYYTLMMSTGLTLFSYSYS